MTGRSRAPTQIQVAVETETYIQVRIPLSRGKLDVMTTPTAAPPLPTRQTARITTSPSTRSTTRTARMTLITRKRVSRLSRLLRALAHCLLCERCFSIWRTVLAIHIRLYRLAARCPLRRSIRSRTACTYIVLYIPYMLAIRSPCTNDQSGQC